MRFVIRMSEKMMKRDVLSQEYDYLGITDFPSPDYLILPIGKYVGNKKLVVGKKLRKYEEIIPGLISPVTGEIVEIAKIPVNGIESDVIRIRSEEEGSEEDHIDVDPESEETIEYLHQKLKGSGFFFKDEIGSKKDLIISAVDSDPLCSVSQQLLRENKKFLKEDFEKFKKIFNKRNIYFVVPEHLFDLVWELQTYGINVCRISARYPNGIPEILVNSIADNNVLDSPVFLKFEEFLNICRAAETGIPNFKKVVTVTDKNGIRNILVIKGTPLKFILKDSELQAAGKVITGGPFRGYANYDLNSPVTDETESIYVQYEKDIVRSVNDQCLNCGRCNNSCPVNLSVNMITRYSEFSIFEKCRDLGVENCIECGLCSFNCPSGRSLVQLIKLAKSEIRGMEGETTL